jgi:ammonium transporter, Amt family
MTIAFFKILDKTIGMRSDPEDEVGGLDLPETGAMSYPDFLEAQGDVFIPSNDSLVTVGANSGGIAAKLRSEVGA